MIPGIDPKVDYAFKKLFGSEANTPVLLDLLNAILNPSPEERIASIELRNPFNDKETLDDKLSIVDVKARDQLGRLYNIEMQMQGSPAYPHRVLYYWAILYGEQLGEGQDYRKLKPTISISIVNDVLFPQVPDFHLEFQLRSSRHPQLVFSAQQKVHLLELPKFIRKAEELANPLEIWCYFLIHGAALDSESLPQALQEPGVNKAMEVLQVMSQNELERERYQARLKYQRDHNMYVDDATEKGLAQGLEKGLAQGLSQGLAQGLSQGLEKGLSQGLEKGAILGEIHLCQRLLKLPLTPREELLAFSVEQLRKIAEDFEQQLGVPKA